MRKNEISTIDKGVKVSPLPFGFDGYMGLTNQLYVSGGVLSGPHYPNGKPSYLQGLEYSKELNITGGRVGFIVNFALGVTGGLFVNRSVSHYGISTLKMPEISDEAYYIYAQLNEDGATMSFGYSTKKGLIYSRFEPENSITGDYWFDIPSNYLKFRRSKEVEEPSGEIKLEYYWEEVKRVIIGWVAQGTDAYIYSMTSFPLNYWFAKEYPEYVKYDGVSLQTDGRFIGENYDSWKDNIEICTNAANSSVARDAIYYGANLWRNPIGVDNDMLTGKMLVGWAEQDLDIGLDAINYTGMDNLTDSAKGMKNIVISKAAMDKIMENELAMNSIVSKSMPMANIASSSLAISVVADNVHMVNKISNSLVAVNEVLKLPSAVNLFKSNIKLSSSLFTNRFAEQLYSNHTNIRDQLFIDITIPGAKIPSFYKEVDALRIRSVAGQDSGSTEYNVEGHFITDVIIDITRFSKLKIEWKNTGSSHPYNYSYFGLSSNKSDKMSSQSHIVNLTREFSRRTSELDISNINGSYYIGASAKSTSGNTSSYHSEIYIYKIWLEE